MLAAWGFSREEDARMIAFMACVKIRMEGKDPAVGLQGGKSDQGRERRSDGDEPSLSR